MQMHAQASAPEFNAEFIEERARRVVENRQDLNYNFVDKTQFKEGYDLTRLVSPPIDQLNEDFLCGICQRKLATLLPIQSLTIAAFNIQASSTSRSSATT